MDIKTIIPLIVIIDSLMYIEPTKCEIVSSDNQHRVIVQNAAVGVKIAFPSSQSYVKVSYLTGFQEFFNVSSINVGLIDSDGWMRSFPAESEFNVQSISEPAVESQVFPDYFITVI